MRIRGDGSVQSAATPTYQNAGRKEDFALYRCMVTKVIYTDDPTNITTNGQNPRVLYDVVVLGGFASGQVISNCRLATDLASNEAYWERTLRASEKDVSKAKLADCDGDVVFVQFLQGHTGFPVIVALDQGINTTKAGIGAARSKGPYSIRQYNGVWEEINSSGEFTVKVKGGTANADKGSFKANADALMTFSATKDEKYTRKFKSGLKVEEDGKSDKITMTTAAGFVITVDGKNDKIELATKGGAKLVIDGKSGSVTAQDNGGGKLKISDGKVGLGTSSNELVDLVKQIADALAAATYPGFGAPASNVADYVTIGAKLGQIKGGV